LFDALSPFIVLNLPIKHGSLSESSFKLPIKTHGWGVNGYIGEGPKCLASDINEKANDKKHYLFQKDVALEVGSRI